MNSLQAIEKLRSVARRQHKSLSTERSYSQWLKRYMAALQQMPQSLSSEAKMERYLSELATRYDVSASTQNQAFNAILFFTETFSAWH